MTNNLAVLFGYERDDTIAGFSQLFHELSLGQLTEGRRNYPVNSLPVAWVFIAEVNHEDIE